jgi:hypothetical protein
MIAEITRPREPSAESLSLLSTFLGAPICWLGTLIMIGCLLGCVIWARRLRHDGRLPSHFPGPLLLALVPITLGVGSSFWFLNHLVQSLTSNIDFDLWLVMGVTFTELSLGLGAFFSSLAIGALIVIDYCVPIRDA